MAWSQLQPSEKKVYEERSAAERRAQRVAAKAVGVRPRGGTKHDWGKSSKTHNKHDSMVRPSPSGLGAMKPLLQESFTVGGFTCSDSETQGIGFGSYGHVVKAQSPTGRLVALKVYGEAGGEDARMEIAIYRKLRHDSATLPFLSLQGGCADGPISWIALPWVPSGTLADAIKASGPLNAESMDAAGQQVAFALRHLHHIGFLHLDVKTSNIIWDPTTRAAFLIDFGLAECWPLDASRRPKAAYVTASYRPPELWAIASRYLMKRLKPCVDVWSYGCIVFEAGSGQKLMGGSDPKSCIDTWCALHVQKKIAALRVQMHRLSPDWHKVVLTCCHPSPDQRPGWPLVLAGLPRTH